MRRQVKISTVAGWLAGLALAVTPSMHAIAGGIPCRYDVIATIQGPDCPPHGPAFVTNATAISPNGLYVCGHYRPCDIGQPLAWYWTAQTGMVIIPLPAGIITAEANDVSDTGLVVGEYQGAANGSGRGFIYDINTGVFIKKLVSVNPTGRCAITAINSSGTVCGWRSIGSKTDPINPYQAFIWSQATGYIDVGVMNGPNSGATGITDTGMIVGWTGAEGFPDITGVRGFVWTGRSAEVLPQVPGGTTSVAVSVGLKDQVLVNGRVQQSPSLYRTFIVEGDNWTQLALPPGFDRTLGRKIGGNDLIGGTCTSTTAPGPSTACIWTTSSYRLLNASTVGQFVGISGSVVDISAQGLVVMGTQNSAGQYLAYVLEPRESTLGDTNCDGLVNIDDLVVVITSWGPCTDCQADFNNDSIVNITDLVTVIQNWSAGP